MRFTLQHPYQARVEAVYGHDRTGIGWFVEVRRKGRLVAEYDGLVDERPTMAGVLRVLVSQGFFTATDVVEASEALQELDVEDITNSRVRRAAQALVDL